MTCPKCNIKLPDGLTVCFGCGAPLIEPVQMQSTKYLHQHGQNELSSQKAGNMKGLNAAVISIFIVLLFGTSLAGHFLGIYTLPLLPERDGRHDAIAGADEYDAGEEGAEDTATPQDSKDNSGSNDTGDQDSTQPPPITEQPPSTPEPTPAGAISVTDMPFTLVNARGEVSVLFTGMWENDAPNGFGKVTYQETRESNDGLTRWIINSTLEGNFIDGLLQGHGEFMAPDGNRYSGNFVDGLRSGQGKYTFPNGDIQEGEWENGWLNGFGKFTGADGRVFEGYWKDSQPHGTGIMTLPDSSYYDGEWFEGMFHGQGRHVTAEGRVQEGRWSRNEFQGR